MYKTAAIGDFEEIGHFALIGADTFFPKSQNDAEKIIDRLCKDEYGAVFLSEKYAGCKKKCDKVLPAVLILPANKFKDL